MLKLPLMAWLSRRVRNRRRAQPTRRPHRSSPELETLEERVVPTIFWTPQYGNETATDYGGPKLGTVSPGTPIYSIFWGSYWDTATGTSAKSNYLNSINGVLNDSAYLDGLHEYGVTYRAFYPAAPVPTVTIDAYDPGSSVSDAQVQSVVNDAIYNHGMPTANTYANAGIYYVITPPGTSSSTYPSAGGYHGPFTDSHGLLTTYGWLGETSDIDSFTYVLSHETAESMTDPQVNLNSGINVTSGASFPNGGNGEVCDWESQNHTYRLNGYLVNSYWSQANSMFEVQDGNSQSVTVNNGSDLVVNGDQLGSAYNDSVTVDTNGSGGVQVTLNGQVFSFDPGQLTSVTINTEGGSNTVNVLDNEAGVSLNINGGGTDTVNLGNSGSVQGIQGAVNIDNPPSYSAVTIDDSADSFGRNVTVSNSGVFGLAPANINFTTSVTILSSLTIDGGSGGNSFTVTSTPLLKGGGTFSLNSGTGNDTVNVQTSSVPLTVNGQDGFDTVNIGNSGSVQSITAAMTIDNPSGYSAVTLDDSADAIGRTVTVSNSGVTGLAPAVINFTTSVTILDALTIDGGSGGNSFTVASTPSLRSGGVFTLNSGTGNDTVNVQTSSVPLTVNGQDGFDTVNIGNSGSVQSITAALTIDNPFGFSAVTLDDSADTTARNVTVSNSGVTGLAPASINFTTSVVILSSLTIDGGSGGNTFTVTSTPSLESGGVFTLNSGTGNDTVNVQASSVPLTVNGQNGNDTVNIGNSGSVQSITAALTIDNPSGFSAVTLDDSADTTARTVTVSNSGVTGLAPASINFTTSVVILSSLTIDGGSGGNSFTVTSTPSLLGGGAFTLNSGAGNDSISIQATSVPLVVNGQNGTDTLTGLNATAIWNITGANAGTVSGGISFGNVENLTGGSGNDTFAFGSGGSVSGTINGGAGSNTLDYSTYGKALGVNLGTGTAPALHTFANIQSLVGSSATNSTLVGANTTNLWTLTGVNAGNVNSAFTFSAMQYLTGGSGADTFKFNPGASVGGTINGGAGSNTLDYSTYGKALGVTLTSNTTGTAPGLLTFSNIEALVGSTATNSTLVGANTSNTWNITGSNAGNVNSAFTFSAMQYLKGGSGNDGFAFASGASVGGTINGQGGTNTLNYAAYGKAIGVTLTSNSSGVAPALLTFANIEALVGSSATNSTLVGAGTTNTFNITAANAGNINSAFTFSAMQYLKGGSGNDSFAFGSAGSLSGTINGQGGTNTLDYSAFGKALGVTLTSNSSGTAPGLLSFSNIEGLVGSTATNSTLIGPNTGNLWNITGTNAGNINGAFTFSAMQYLKGGSGNDTFHFTSGGSLSGSINGQGGNNTLDYSALPGGVTVNLAGNTASLTGGVSNINGVLGGQGNNTLTGSNTLASFLVGGAGNDKITGGSAAAVLIGAAGSDTLNGGSGQDILLGGTTSFDNSANIAALDAILAEWGSADSYSQRVGFLSGPTGHLNGTTFLNSSTVSNDNTADTLTGGSGTDWFFQSSGDTVNNIQSGATVTTI